MANLPITLAVSYGFQEKEALNKSAYGYDWQTVSWTEAQIIKHVQQGNALCVAALKSGHRQKSEFQAAQIIGIDFDSDVEFRSIINADILALGYCFYGYPTASSTDEHPRTRLLFALDEPVDDAALYRKLVKRVVHYYRDYRPDTGVHDEVRIFYGSTKDGMSKLGARVTIAQLSELPPHPSELPPEQRAIVEARLSAPDTGKRDYMPYAKAIIDRTLGNVTSAGAGSRNTTLNRAAFKLGQLAAASWSGISQADAERWLMQAAPISSDFPQAEAQATITSGLKAGAGEALPEPPDTRLKREISRQARPQTVDERIAAAAPTLAPPEEFSISSSALIANFDGLLNTPSGKPVMMPFTRLQSFGGFCKAIPAGKLIGVVGISGGMKSSFMETMTDMWRRSDTIDIGWWGPEWLPAEMLWRAVQRYGTKTEPTASFEDIMLHQRWKAEEQQAVPLDKRQGKLLTPELYKRSKGIADWIAGWPGKAHYVRRMDIGMDDLLAEFDRLITSEAQGGRDVRILVWDYVQLMQLRDVRNEGERIEVALGLLKSFCADRHVIGVVASQVTKSQALGVKTAGDVLEPEAGQFLRSDKFNLVLTLSPQYVENQILEAAVVNVGKNSLGRTGRVVLKVDPSRLRWLDELGAL